VQGACKFREVVSSWAHFSAGVGGYRKPRGGQNTRKALFVSAMLSRYHPPGLGVSTNATKTAAYLFSSHSHAPCSNREIPSFVFFFFFQRWLRLSFASLRRAWFPSACDSRRHCHHRHNHHHHHHRRRPKPMAERSSGSCSRSRMRSGPSPAPNRAGRAPSLQ